MPDGQGRPFARGDQQVVMPFEQETERIGPVQAGDGRLCRVAR